MKSAFWKDIFREIRGTLNRFFAIFAIVALGVGFFAGLKATTPDMQLTADTYLDDQHFMDVRLLCTMGFTQEDAEALSQLDYIDAVMPTYEEDVLVEAEDGNVAIKMEALPSDTQDSNKDYLNRPVLLDGRLPSAPGECAFDPGTTTGAVAGSATSFGAIGSTIRLSDENDLDTLDLLKSREYTVVGTIRSPAYISFQRGSTDIGSGRLSYYMMVADEEFDSEYYLEMYATVKGASTLDTFSDAYDDLMDGADQRLKQFGNRRAQIRYSEIYGDAEAEIRDAEEELADGQSEYDTQKADADKELEEARKELEEARKEIEDAQTEIAQGEADLASGEAEYNESVDEFNDQIASAQRRLEQSQEQLNSSRAEFESGWAEYQSGQQQLDTLYAQIAQMQEAGMPEEQIAALEAQAQAAQAQLSQSYAQLQSAADELSSGQQEINAGWEQLESQRATGEAELNAARTRLENARTELENARQRLAEGQADLEEGQATYDQNEADANRELADAKKELDDGQKEIDDAWSDLQDVEVPEWYVLDRSTNIGFANFASDSQKIENLSDVFPVFFFLVAALVCLTTMTRMVEEQRTQIGVLKALGYGKCAIAAKYLIYAALATITGCVVGLVIGFRVFPTVIWHAYGIMYTMRPVICDFNWPLALTGGGAATAVTLLAAFWAVYAELTAVPAELIRPKSPPAGKRILLEKIGFIWNKMKFTSKVTARNLFRYKQRLFMTVIGIAGCTALMVTGFGLRDSISRIVEHQFTEIQHYDALVSLKDAYEPSQEEELSEAMGSVLSDYALVAEEIGTATREGAGRNVDVRVFVPENPDILSNFIAFRDRQTHDSVPFPDGNKVVVTEKMADMLGLRPGDTVDITLDDTKTGHAIVGGITENYVYNYAYMPPQTYEAMFHEQPRYKMALAQAPRSAQEGEEPQQLDEQEENEISTQIIENELIESVQFTSRTSRDFGDVMRSLDAVVWLLVVCSNLLAFVVLYNLVNISITERAREIATIKVLGFYNREVDSYVFRENLILTAIGAVIGLIGGVFLHQYVVSQAEVDIVMFERIIQPMSYVYAFVLTMVFALVVDWLMHFKLKKISMVESLKSTE